MFVNVQSIVIVVLLASIVSARSKEKSNFEKESKKQPTSMLTEIAKELTQRSASSSQVFNLNLSNLLLLLVLKTVVFGAGYIGHHGYKGRDLVEETFISESEVALALGYLIGDTCLYRAACEVPHTAKEYLSAAEMIIQSMKLIPQSLLTDRKYEKTIAEFRKAIEYGTLNKCPAKYTCQKKNIDDFFRFE